MVVLAVAFFPEFVQEQGHTQQVAQQATVFCALSACRCTEPCTPTHLECECQAVEL